MLQNSRMPNGVLRLKFVGRQFVMARSSDSGFKMHERCSSFTMGIRTLRTILNKKRKVLRINEGGVICKN